MKSWIQDINKVKLVFKFTSPLSVSCWLTDGTWPETAITPFTVHLHPALTFTCILRAHEPLEKPKHNNRQKCFYRLDYTAPRYGGSRRTIDRKKQNNKQTQNKNNTKDSRQDSGVCVCTKGRKSNTFLLTSRLKFPGLEFSELMMGT